MVSCIAGAFYNHSADILEQFTSVNEETGETERSWKFLKKINGYVFPYIAGGLRGMGSHEVFDDHYANTDFLRIKTHNELDKRWRVTNIKINGEVLYQEGVDGLPTVYDVDGSAPIYNPLSGGIDEWLSTLSRSQVQGIGTPT